VIVTASEDLIDQAYFLFIRPLGNLVVLCAQAEAALLAFVAELMRRDEPAAHAVLKKKHAQRTIIELVQQESNIQDFERSELVHAVEHYYSDCKRRNRYMHDEWYVSLLTNIGVPRTRGFPRKKDSQPVWDDPTPDGVWRLASRFRGYKQLFSDSTYLLRQRRSGYST
jgi:hypothetical protein